MFPPITLSPPPGIQASFETYEDIVAARDQHGCALDPIIEAGECPLRKLFNCATTLMLKASNGILVPGDLVFRAGETVATRLAHADEVMKYRKESRVSLLSRGNLPIPLYGLHVEVDDDRFVGDGHPSVIFYVKRQLTTLPDQLAGSYVFIRDLFAAEPDPEPIIVEAICAR